MFIDFCFGLVDQFSDLDAPGTDAGALEKILTGPDSVWEIQLRKPVLKTFIPAVIDKPGRLDDGGRAEKIGLDAPDDRTGRIAGRAQNAFGPIIDNLSFLR